MKKAEGTLIFEGKITDIGQNYNSNFGRNQTFGFNLNLNKKSNKSKSDLESFHIDVKNDVFVGAGFDRLGFTGAAGSSLINDDEMMINEYRKLALDDTIEFALGEIKNASFTNNEPGEYVIGIEFINNTKKDFNVNKSTQDLVLEAFYHVYDLIQFTKTCRQLFIEWYVDSRIVFHKVIDSNKPKLGIQDLIKIESTQIKRITVYPEPNPISGIYNLNEVQDVYVYHHRNLTDYSFGRTRLNVNNTVGTYGSTYGGNYIFINPEVITYVESGIEDRSTKSKIGYLQTCILPYNKYMMMEDSMVIFRITRAPSRLAVYVDVGNKTGQDAEKALNDVKNNLKSDIRYNVSSSQVTSRSDIMSLAENYYLTRTKDGNTTEITPIQGGDFDGILEETGYFLDKLKRSTRVPMGRWDDGSGGGEWLFGRGTGHQLKEEQRFESHIYDAKLIFTSGIFDDLIKTQLLLTGGISNDEEWDKIRGCFEYTFVESNLIVEYKKHELLGQRSNSAKDFIELVERGWVTDRWVQRNILYLTDEDLDNMKDEVEEFAEMTQQVNEINDRYGLNDVGDTDENEEDDGDEDTIDMQYDDEGKTEEENQDVTKQPEDKVGETQKNQSNRADPNKIERGNKPRKTHAN